MRRILEVLGVLGTRRETEAVEEKETKRKEITETFSLVTAT